jgi:hypothetical protein
MVETGAGLVCASRSEALAHSVAETFQKSGVVCEVSDDPVLAQASGGQARTFAGRAGTGDLVATAPAPQLAQPQRRRAPRRGGARRGDPGGGD